MKKEVYYPDYIQLDKVLNAQSLESEKNGHKAHDEMLFIITHQAMELWMKQIHVELESIIHLFQTPSVDEASLGIIAHRLERITEIQKLMTRHFTVLETMTPLDFLDFREDLIPASGFQSMQFKMLEKKLGIYKNHPDSMKTYAKQALKKPEHAQLDEKVFSLFEGVEQWLERNPFIKQENYLFEEAYQSTISKMMDHEKSLIKDHPFLSTDQKKKEHVNLKILQEQYEQIFEEQVDVEIRTFSKQAFLSALFIHLYRDQPMIQLPYRVLRILIDVDQLHVAWKQKHVSIVRKMIGLKMGTGGSSGKKYLAQSIASSNIFPDLVTLPSYMVPRKHIPTLPEAILKQLGFNWA